jgi:hypothetical protein
MCRPRYDAEEADSSRRQSERALLPSPPNRMAHSSDDTPLYPIQQSETSAGRLPASNFSVGRPLGSQFSQVPVDPARARTDYSWSPPSSSGDPRTPSHSARHSMQWSPTGATFHDTNPNAQHSSYQYSQPHAHSTASPHVNPRELFFSQQQYARSGPGASGWTPRTPTSPEIADRRISAAHPLSSMTPNQPPYTSPYIDEHRREEYHGGAPRGS